MRHMAQHLGHAENQQSAESFLKRADEAKRRANLMREAAINGGLLQGTQSLPEAERSSS